MTGASTFTLSDISWNVYRPRLDEPRCYLGSAKWHDLSENVGGTALSVRPATARTLAICEAVERRAWYEFNRSSKSTVTATELASQDVKELDKVTLRSATTGWAAGRTAAQATQNATAEVVERHLLNAFLMGRTGMEALSPPDDFRLGRYQLGLRSGTLGSDLGWHVSVSMISDETVAGPASSFGAGAGRSAAEASRKATREALKTRAWCYLIKAQATRAALSAEQERVLFFATETGGSVLKQLFDDRMAVGVTNIATVGPIAEVDLSPVVRPPLPVSFVVPQEWASLPVTISIGSDEFPSPFV